LGSFEICLVGVSPPKLPVATELVTKSSGESKGMAGMACAMGVTLTEGAKIVCRK